jgi:transposase-like protein
MAEKTVRYTPEFKRQMVALARSQSQRGLRARAPNSRVALR